MKKESGFSLIELLIVVAIILIIAAIAIPNLLRSRMAANEASAAASERTISTANVTYSSTYNIGFAGALTQLGPTGGSCASVSSGCADLIDSTLGGAASPTKSGYKFTYAAPNATPTSTATNGTYSVVGTPVATGSSGTSSFCVDQGNVVLKDSSGATTSGANTGCGWTIGGTIAPL